MTLVDSLPADSFYRRLADHEYQPTQASVGPWAPDLLHGGPPIALLAKVLREFEPQAAMEITRLSVEFLGPVPLAPCRVEARMVRGGRRVELVEACMHAGGRDVMLARAWRMQRQSGCVRPVPDAFTLPALPARQEQTFFPGVTHFPYAHALEWRFVQGSYDTLGPALVWARARIELVRGEPTAGLERLLLMLDSANGVSAELALKDWSFVPVDLQLSLHRAPQGEWVGMDARTVLDGDGIGTSHATVFDAGGACGRSLHTLFVRPR